MKNNFFNNSLGNINLKPNSKSEVTSQILYGEKFKIISEKQNWIKIKTYYDNYIGYIRKKKYLQKFNPSKKIFKLKSRIYERKNKKLIKTNDFLYFGSRISVKSRDRNYIEFDNGKWIKKNDVQNINHYEKNFNKILKLFLNTKYLWGGKTSEGIDC